MSRDRAVDPIFEFLRSCPRFADVADESLRRFAERSFERRLGEGELLCRQGEPGDALYVLRSGVADALLDDGQGGLHLLGVLRPSDIVGEMAVWTREPRNNHVRARTKVEAVGISAADYWALLPEHGDLTAPITTAVSEHIDSAPRDGLAEKVLEGFRILRRAGRGAFGIVYVALDLGSGRNVALKMLAHRLLIDRRAVERFEDEFRIASAIEHEGVIRYHQMFPAYGTSIIQMEFCDGPTLADLLKSGGPLPLSETIAILGTLAATLSDLHRHGVVHGDLTPVNVMFTSRGEVKLTDFGLAALRQVHSVPPAEHDRAVAGTPCYMAPELLRGSGPTPATDLFALGCLLYEMCTGHRLYAQSSWRQLVDVTESGPLPPLELSGPDAPSLEATYRRLVSRDPTARAESIDWLVGRRGSASPPRVARAVGGLRRESPGGCASESAP